MTTTETEAPSVMQTAQTDQVINLLGSIIAKSRYEAWEGNATGVSWEDYRVANPAVASNIYLEDGRRDAVALMPVLTGAINQAAVKVLRELADDFVLREMPAAEACATRRADNLDWRRQVQG